MGASVLSTRWTKGARKDSVYRKKPGSLEELRLSVEQYASEVPADTAGRVGVGFQSMLLEAQCQAFDLN